MESTCIDLAKSTKCTDEDHSDYALPTAAVANVRLMAHRAIEAATEDIEEKFGERLAACESLRDFGLDFADPWCGRPLNGVADTIVAALFIRSANSNWAVLELSRIGFGKQGEMLERALFEDMIDAHWVTVERELAEKRFDEHLRHGAILFGDAARHHPEQYDPKDLPTVDENQRKALNKVFGEFGHKSWTGVNLHGRVDAVEHLWPDGAARRQMRFFARIVQRYNNNQLHVSAHSLNSMVLQNTDEAISFHVGPCPWDVEKALFTSLWTETQIQRLVLRYFDFPQATSDELESIFTQGATLFRRLSDEELAGVGRNDPCPCGSGKKFKRCHGA